MLRVYFSFIPNTTLYMCMCACVCVVWEGSGMSTESVLVTSQPYDCFPDQVIVDLE